MEQAIEFEAARQIEILEGGGRIEQETRLYDPDRNETRSMRSKEDAQDYRYFPDPDLLPLSVNEELLKSIRGSMPELPEAKRQRYVDNGVPAAVAGLLVASRDRAEFFEQAVAGGAAPDAVAHLVVGDLAGMLNDAQSAFSRSPVTPDDVATLQKRVADGTISGKIAKDLLRAVFNGEGRVDALIESRGLKQISDAGAIEQIVDEVLAKNAKQVEDYRAGKDKAFNSLVGQVMKATQGKANPAQVNEILRKKLAR
jgi:aspartyl-tRNA(Asn)/glutamyl-tRNA(Gln) amidotransferase subunit B